MGTKTKTRRVFEVVFIVPPSQTEDEVDRVVDAVREIFSGAGGEVRLVEKWGKRRLAYPVRKHQDGWYVMMHVHGPGEVVIEAERRLRLNENVIKFLTVRLDDVPGALEHAEQRLQARARQERERAQRAAEKEQRAAEKEERERAKAQEDASDEGSSERVDAGGEDESSRSSQEEE